MRNSAIILAGGFSKRFGQEKGLIELFSKPLILHIIDTVLDITDEIVVVVGSIDQKKAFSQIIDDKAFLVIDKCEQRSPIIGALTGFEKVRNNFSLLLPCDTPFLSKEVASTLLNLCIDKNAVIPRWSNGFIEPLQAAYRTKPTLDAAKNSLNDKKFDFQSMLTYLRRIKYISTRVLNQIDPGLLTFFNINTQEDLKKAKRIKN